MALSRAPSALRTIAPLRVPLSKHASHFSTASATSSPRHLLSIADLSAKELQILVRAARQFKKATKSGKHIWKDVLERQTVGIMFSKRSTRTRVSTEGAVALLGGHPMFLGKDDIQLGVNESLRDTSIVLSSMTSSLVARVGPHSDITSLAQHSTVPVINALSDLYHPMQAIADILTLHENYSQNPASSNSLGLGLEGRRIAWVGDANNVLYDLALSAAKLGMHVVAATPKGYDIPRHIMESVKTAAAASSTPGSLNHTDVPEEAIKDADILVTDTWISMGQEAEKAARLKAFEGFQVTEELAKRGGARDNWVFMHCLPRKQEEVSDEVFYGRRSLVFPEAENRLWAAGVTLAAFVGRKGTIDETLLAE
jgi:ornithine carbamoyltransferase